MKLPGLSLCARNGLQRLSRLGITPDWEDVAALQALGAIKERPDTGTVPVSVLNLPVTVGNITLWPWTLGARRWYYERAARWYATAPELDLLANVFALVNSTADGAARLKAIVTAEQATAALREFHDGCGATLDELEAAIDAVLPPPGVEGKGAKYCAECGQLLPPADDGKPLPPPPGPGVWVDLVGMLMQAFPGTTRDYWAWTEPESVSMRLLNVYAARQRAAGGTADAGSPLMQATHAFETALRQIRAKHESKIYAAKLAELNGAENKGGAGHG